MIRSPWTSDRSRESRRREVRPSVEGLEGRMLLSKGMSPAAVARARNQAGNSPTVPQLNTPIPTIHVRASGLDDPSFTNVVMAPKVKLTGSVSTSFGVVWLGRGPKGQFTTSTVAAQNGFYDFDIKSRPGDNVVRVFTASSSSFGVSSQYSPITTYRYVLADPVVGWDSIATQAVWNQKLSAPDAARALATVHVAQYDAIASIRSPKSVIHTSLTAPKGASEAAAASAAAHSVLSVLFPDQVSMFDAALTDARSGLADNKATRDGIVLGGQVAAATLAWRAENSTAPFLPTGTTSLLPAAPPVGGSAEFNAALDQVKAIGETNSTTRTDRQTLTAQFWNNSVGTPTNPSIWNQAAQRLAVTGNRTLWSNARTFALLNVAMADAGTVSQEAKTTYRLFHPAGVIQQTDPGWTSLVPTPGDYSYSSDQAAYASAASSVLTSVFGSKTPVTLTSNAFGTSRDYDTIGQAADDAAQSGVYGGVQYSFDVSAGTKLGDAVAQNVLNRFPNKK